jgi:hypothetical protein
MLLAQTSERSAVVNEQLARKPKSISPASAPSDLDDFPNRGGGGGGAADDWLNYVSPLHAMGVF